MQKMPTIFLRDQVGKRALARDEINPEAAWVFEGEGTAYLKWDGTCCAVIDGEFYKRLHLRRGKPKPEGWRHWSGEPAESGHGWTPVQSGPEDARHIEAWLNSTGLEDGTYELIGPRVQGNPHEADRLKLIRHKDPVSQFTPVYLSFDRVQALMASLDWEGLVWHHPDGRMAKIKRRDFGFQWPIKRGASQ